MQVTDQVTNELTNEPTTKTNTEPLLCTCLSYIRQSFDISSFKKKDRLGSLARLLVEGEDLNVDAAVASHQPADAAVEPKHDDKEVESWTLDA